MTENELMIEGGLKKEFHEDEGENITESSEHSAIVSRRQFVKQLALGALGAGLAGRKVSEISGKDKENNKKTEIDKVELSMENHENDFKKVLGKFPTTKEGYDYNRFDNLIIQAVDNWNEYYSKNQVSKFEPLDPNLVKAMMFVESKMGEELGRGSKDLLQVAVPENGTQEVMRGKKEEYELIQGELVQFLMPEIMQNSYAARISCGVRWLFHKAQIIKQKQNEYYTEWLSWNKAVGLYNGGGDPGYEKKVNKIYNMLKSDTHNVGS